MHIDKYKKPEYEEQELQDQPFVFNECGYDSDSALDLIAWEILHLGCNYDYMQDTDNELPYICKGLRFIYDWCGTYGEGDFERVNGKKDEENWCSRFNVEADAFFGSHGAHRFFFSMMYHLDLAAQASYYPIGLTKLGFEVMEDLEFLLKDRLP